MYYRFFHCKSYNIEAAELVAVQANCKYVFFLFQLAKSYHRSNCTSSKVFLSYTYLAKIVMQKQLCQQLVRSVTDIYLKIVLPYSGNYTNSWSGRLHIPILAFLYIKLIIQGQLYQQLIKPIISTCFRFFIYKNRIAKIAILAAGQANYTYLFLFFPL